MYFIMINISHKITYKKTANNYYIYYLHTIIANFIIKYAAIRNTQFAIMKDEKSYQVTQIMRFLIPRITIYAPNITQRPIKKN